MPRTLGNVGVVIGRLWRHSLRQPAIAYILPTAMPLGLVVFISQLYGAMATRPGYPTDDLLDWMGPGMVFLAATMGGGFTGTLLVIDAQTGMLDRLRLLPLNGRSIVVACLVFEGLRIVPVSIILLAAAGLLGLSLPGPAGLALVIVLAAVWAAAWNSMFLVAALRTQNAQLPLVLLPLFLPFFLGSTIMVPEPLLPNYVRALIAWNPLDRFVVAVRPLFDDAALIGSDVAIAIGAATVVIALLGALADRQITRLTRP